MLVAPLNRGFSLVPEAAGSVWVPALIWCVRGGGVFSAFLQCRLELRAKPSSAALIPPSSVFP